MNAFHVVLQDLKTYLTVSTIPCTYEILLKGLCVYVGILHLKVRVV